MTRKTFLGVMVVALVTILTMGGLFASNIGFKVNYSLFQSTVATPDGASKSGRNVIALPDNKQSGMATAKDLMDDIGFASVTNVERFNRNTDAFVAYTGRAPQTPANNFTLATPPVGYRIQMKTSVNYIIAGSDDPAQTYDMFQSLAATPDGSSKSGRNLFSYNYHQTAGTAKALMDDIGFLSVTNVERFNKSTDAFVAYTGRAPQTPANDFGLAPGQAYRVQMKTTTVYTPSHY